MSPVRLPLKLCGHSLPVCLLRLDSIPSGDKGHVIGLWHHIPKPLMNGGRKEHARNSNDYLVQNNVRQCDRCLQQERLRDTRLDLSGEDCIVNLGTCLERLIYRVI